MAYSIISSVIGQGSTSAIDTTGANLIVLSPLGSVTGGWTITDSKSNTWTALSQGGALGDAGAQIYYSYAPTVGTGHTFAGGISFISLAAIAASGAVSTPLDKESHAGTYSLSATTAGSITPIEDNELVVAFVANGADVSAQILDSGYTTDKIISAITGTRYGGGMGHIIQTTAGATNPQWTWTGNATVSSVIASFKTTAAGVATRILRALLGAGY